MVYNEVMTLIAIDSLLCMLSMNYTSQWFMDYHRNLTTITVELGFLGDFFFSKPVHFIIKNYLYKRLMT